MIAPPIPWLTANQINMAVATRMAILMELHREETYVLVTPTKELIVRAESARRTLVPIRLPACPPACLPSS